MQQRRLQQTRVGPEIETDVGFQILGLEAGLPLPQCEIAGERHLRHVVIDLADRLADIELLLDQIQRHRLAMTERRHRCLAHLGKPRNAKPRMAASEGQSRRLDRRGR